MQRNNYARTLVMIVIFIRSYRFSSCFFLSRHASILDRVNMNIIRSGDLLSFSRHSHSGFDTDDFGRQIRRQDETHNRNDNSPSSWQENKSLHIGETDRIIQRSWSRKPQNGRMDYPNSSKSSAFRPFDTKANRLEVTDDKINMRSFESAGLVHLYGLNPVLSALTANIRDFQAKQNHADAGSMKAHRPETQLTPYLFVQEKFLSKRSPGKSNISHRILDLANSRQIPVATVDKGGFTLI
jgi:hypothetical protein